MPKHEGPDYSDAEPKEIDQNVKDVIDEETRFASGRGPSIAKEVRRKRALARALLKAMKAKDERAFSEQLRRAGVKDASPEWKKAWEIYRATWPT